MSHIEYVKQPSPSVKPANQLLFKPGRIVLFIIVTACNLIFPLLAQLLKPAIKRYKLYCLVGKTVFPVKILRMIYISLLLCVTYLLHFRDCDITFPKPKVYFI